MGIGVTEVSQGGDGVAVGGGQVPRPRSPCSAPSGILWHLFQDVGQVFDVGLGTERSVSQALPTGGPCCRLGIQTEAPPPSLGGRGVPPKLPTLTQAHTLPCLWSASCSHRMSSGAP